MNEDIKFIEEKERYYDAWINVTQKKQRNFKKKVFRTLNPSSLTTLRGRQ